MENAVDAIVMAGEMLIFIVALTVCITSLNTLNNTLGSIIGDDETIKLASYTDAGTGSTQYANYIASKQNNAIRVVGPETVVTSLYRASKEAYTVYIKFDSKTISNYGLDNVKDKIDGIDEIFSNLKYALTFNIDGTTETIISTSDEIIKAGRDQEYPISNYINALLSEGLYEAIMNCTFYEYLGEYQNANDTNSANKDTYRIVTYIQITNTESD